jgi:tRNA(Ile)-lysidine synthase TilS/MesJ
MLSGGKDSVFILDALSSENRRILAFTMHNPYESEHAMKNTARSIAKTNTEHVTFTPDSNIYKKVLKWAFEQRGCMSGEIRPCGICSRFTRIQAFLFALRMNIPYVLYCADPFQIMSTHIDAIDIRGIARTYIDIIGWDETDEVFDHRLEYILGCDLSEIPKIIYPFIARMDCQNEQEIINHIQKKGLYQSSRWETHCRLYPLLNYYTYTRYQTYYYDYELADDVRKGKIGRDEAMDFTKKYGHVITQLMPKQHISVEDEDFIRETLVMKFGGQCQALEHEYNSLMMYRDVASELGISFKTI